MTRLSITSSGHRLSPPSCDHCWWLKGLEVIVRRWERSVSRVSRLSFGSPFVTQSLPVPTAHLPQLGGRLLTSPPTSLRSAHGTNERSDVRREERDERKEGGGLVTHVPFPTALSARFLRLSRSRYAHLSLEGRLERNRALLTGSSHSVRNRAGGEE